MVSFSMDNTEQRISQAVRRLVYNHPTVLARHSKAKQYAWTDNRTSPDDMSTVCFMPEDEWNLPLGTDASYFSRKAPLRQLYYASHSPLTQIRLETTLGGQYVDGSKYTGECRQKQLHTRHAATNPESRLRMTQTDPSTQSQNPHTRADYNCLPEIPSRDSALSILAPVNSERCSEIDFPLSSTTPQVTAIPTGRDADDVISASFSEIPEHYQAWGRRNHQCESTRYKFEHRNPSKKFNQSGQTVRLVARRKGQSPAAATAAETSRHPTSPSETARSNVGGVGSAQSDERGLPLLKNYWLPEDSYRLDEGKAGSVRGSSQASARTKLSDVNTLDVRFPSCDSSRNPAVVTAKSPVTGVSAKPSSSASAMSGSMSRLSGVSILS